MFFRYSANLFQKPLVLKRVSQLGNVVTNKTVCSLRKREFHNPVTYQILISLPEVSALAYYCFPFLGNQMNFLHVLKLFFAAFIFIEMALLRH